MAMTHLMATYQRNTWTFVSTSSNGYTTWTNLVLLSQVTAITPELVVIDPVNDDSTDFRKATCEALIRKIRAALPNCRLVLMKFFTVADQNVDANVNSPTNSGSFQQWADLATHYGIQIVDFYTEIQALVNGGAHLNTYLADVVHPTTAGHTVAYNELLPYLISSQSPIAPVPARLYALSADYENNAPTTQLGTAYTSRTGTWSDNGTQVISSEVGATITYTATCQSFAIYRADGLANGVEYSVDGGAYLGMNDYPPYGWPLASRASHTVTFKVTSGTLKIDEVWFI